MKRLDQEIQSQRRRAPRYARIYFDVRVELGVSVTDYLLVEVIFVLSRRGGWCYASREYLSRLLGVSSRSLQRSLQRLKDAGLVEERPGTPRLLRPSALWIAAVRGAQSAASA